MIYLACDHRGFYRKEEIKRFLVENQLEFVDVGAREFDPNDDEVDFVNEACSKLRTGDKLIAICGSGVMVDIAANKNKGVRACLAFGEDQVRMARNDDDVNALCLAADFFNFEETVNFVKIFLNTNFSNEERFVRRIKKLWI